MKFKYSAKTKDGRHTQKGEIEAPNQKSAIDLLKKNDLVVFSLIPVSESQITLTDFQSVLGISLGEKVRFTDQLANMITAGLAMTKALEILAGQAKNPKMAEVIKMILSDVEAGSSLHDSISKHPKIFSESYISLIRAGESSGKLDAVLRRLADTMEKQNQFRSKVRSAMIYPIIITLAMVAVFTILMVSVIPKLAVMYESLDVELPAITQAMISLSNFMVNSWYIMLAIIIVSVVAFIKYKQTEGGAMTVAKIVFKFPVFGNLSRQSGLVEFTGTLSLLVESGVPIIDGLKIVKNTTGNIIYRQAIERFVEDVRHGMPLSQTVMKEETFPTLVSEMLMVGEETGTMDQRLASLSEYFENEVNKIVKNLSAAMEPMIMVVLGIMVGVLMFAVVTPIYKLTAAF